MENVYYIFSKKEIEKYNVQKTKENVDELISKYKEAKYSYFASTKALENISSCFKPKNIQTKIHDKIGENISKKIDSENFIKSYDEVLNPLLETLTHEEKKYYLHCLVSEKSEQTLADSLGISRTGLKNIKNNCILKIALTFQIAVKI